MGDVRQSLRMRQGKIRERIAKAVVDEEVKFVRESGAAKRWLVVDACAAELGVGALLEELDVLGDQIREIDDAERRLLNANEKAERALRERMEKKAG